MRRLSRTRPIRSCRNTRRSIDRMYSTQIGEHCGPTWVAFGRGISAELQSNILEHDELCCRMCGVTPGDIDDLTGHEVRFRIGKIVPRKVGGKDEESNLRVLCSTCYRGAKELLKRGTSDNRPISKFLIGLFGANRP